MLTSEFIEMDIGNSFFVLMNFIKVHFKFSLVRSPLFYLLSRIIVLFHIISLILPEVLCSASPC